ncbi:C-terminal domain of homeodomain 1-domain-containing protein [Scleroderma citrinum]
MTSLQDHILRAEDDFFSAMLHGPSALERFSGLWSRLQYDVQGKVDSLDERTTAIAHAAIQRIMILAQTLSDITNHSESLTQSLMGDFFTVLSSISFDGHTDPPQSSSTSLPFSQQSNQMESDRRFSPFRPIVEPAYRWLLDNLHDPYPPREVKDGLVQSAGVSIHNVNAWFANARRRMGWTHICKSYFGGCRSDTVDAAFRALIKTDPNRSLPAEIVQAFVEMKVTAEGLYSSAFTKSALAGDLDVVVKDMSEENWAGAERTESLVLKKAGDNKNQCTSVSAAYPSPSDSRSSSPLLLSDASSTSLTDGSDLEYPTAPRGSRRNWTLAFDAEDHMSWEDLPRKRHCPSATSYPPTHSVSCPLPLSSFDTQEPSDDELSVLLSSQSSTSQVLSTRPCSLKRRHSDSGLQPMGTRPSHLPTEPRNHVVSDPLPRPSLDNGAGVYEQFDTNIGTYFDFPPPIDIADIDQSIIWEVEFFNNYSNPFHETSPAIIPSIDYQEQLNSLDAFVNSSSDSQFPVDLGFTVNTTVSKDPFIYEPRDPSSRLLQSDGLIRSLDCELLAEVDKFLSQDCNSGSVIDLSPEVSSQLQSLPLSTPRSPDEKNSHSFLDDVHLVDVWCPKECSYP